jgi:hypothetical protein
MLPPLEIQHKAELLVRRTATAVKRQQIVIHQETLVFSPSVQNLASSVMSEPSLARLDAKPSGHLGVFWLVLATLMTSRTAWRPGCSAWELWDEISEVRL